MAVPFWPNNDTSRKPAAAPPANCATQYAIAFTALILPPTSNPNVTAGLRWPPEIPPVAETITAIVNPCASATPSKPMPIPGSLLWIAPTPMKMSANVPMNSATHCLSNSWLILFFDRA